MRSPLSIQCRPRALRAPPGSETSCASGTQGERLVPRHRLAAGDEPDEGDQGGSAEKADDIGNRQGVNPSLRPLQNMTAERCRVERDLSCERPAVERRSGHEEEIGTEGGEQEKRSE